MAAAHGWRGWAAEVGALGGDRTAPKIGCTQANVGGVKVSGVGGGGACGVGRKA